MSAFEFAFTLFGLPDQATSTTRYAVKIPWVMGLIATRSFDTPVTGINDLKVEHEARIVNGMKAYAALQALKSGDKSAQALAAFDKLKDDLGYGLLLKRYTSNVVDATPAQIKAAVNDTIPRVAPIFWSFRVMVALGFWFLFVFASAFYLLARRRLYRNRWILKAALWSIPLPWIAAELGWIVAEYGRQPWSISEVLPTYLSTSSLSAGQLYFSLGGFVLFYTGLLIVEMVLMVKYARQGPSSLGTGRYDSEATPAPAAA